MKNIFKTTMTMCLVFGAMLVANTSMAQSPIVTIDPTNIVMLPGAYRSVEITASGGEITNVTTAPKWGGIVEVTPISRPTYSSPLKWIFRVMGVKGGTITVKFTVTISDGNGGITTITVYLTVTVITDTPESLSLPASPVSMDAIKQD